jgi:hypothetical protein
MFSSEKIPPKDLEHFKSRCAQGISLYGKETLLLLAEKPL